MNPVQAIEPIESVEEIEELSDDAIIAQQSQAHLPQKRANVQEESRSVVISEEPVASSRRPGVYRAEHEAATIVIRDRQDVQAFKQRAMAVRQRHRRGVAWYVWAVLAVLAFAAGGLVTLVILRSTASQAMSSPRAKGEPSHASAATHTQSAKGDSTTPQVQLEELPLETAHPR